MAVDEKLDRRGICRFSHSAMATLFEIYCAEVPEEYARQAAMRAFDIADQVEMALSRFIAGSDISRINALAPGARMRVDVRVMDCLQIAKWAHTASDGAFDVAIGTGFGALELCPEEHEVRSHAPGIRLDFGGIGKGYAVDRMAASLEEWDLHHVLIHAGYSSVLALEPPSGMTGWPLTLSDPAGVAVLARISAHGKALSGSGIKKKDHIIDPRTMRPVRLRQAAWVAGPRATRGEMHLESASLPDTPSDMSPAAVADALSTAFMILSGEEIGEFCSRHTGMEVWILEGADSGVQPIALHHFPP